MDRDHARDAGEVRLDAAATPVAHQVGDVLVGAESQFHHEPPFGTKYSRRVRYDAIVKLESAFAAEERNVRLIIPHLALQPLFVHQRHVRRVGDDQVDTGRRDRLHQIASDESDSCAEPLAVLRGDYDCGRGDVRSPGGSTGLELQGHGQRSRSRADIKDARGVAGQSQGGLHDVLGFRPRDEDVGRHAELPSVKFLPARNVLSGLALEPLVQIPAVMQPFDLAQFLLGMRVEVDALAAHGVRQQHFRSQSGNGNGLVLQKTSSLEQSRCHGHQRILVGCCALAALIALQLARAVIGDERVDDLVHLAIHHEIELMEGESDAVVGDAVLREVVGADLLAAVAGAYHAAAFSAERGLLLLEFDFVETGAQHALRLGTILDLRLLILAGDHQPSGKVSDANRRVGGVYRLPAWTRGTERIDANVLGLELDFDVVRYGQHRHRDGGSVHASLLFGDRHPLHAMHAAFVAQLAVNLVAAHQGDDFLQAAHRGLAAGRDFDLPVLRLRIARVHAENLVREQRGFVAAGTGTDFEHNVLLVERIARQHEDLQFFLNLGELRLQVCDLFLSHFAKLGILILQHRAGLREAAVYLLPLAKTGYDFGQLAVSLGDFAVLVGVRNYGGIGHLPVQLFKTLLELLELRYKLHIGSRDD